MFPLLQQLKTYTKQNLFSDLNSGILVSVLLIPQCIAYAFLAGMPPIYGFYGGLIPTLIYAFMGSSRFLSVGPVAISAILILQGVSQLAEPFSQPYIELVILCGLLIGLFQIALGLLKMGQLANFISHPVIAGFVSAAAIIIIINQFKDILGIKIPRFHFSFETFAYAVKNYPTCNLISVAMFFGAFILMYILKKIHNRIPYALIAVILSIGLTAIFRFDLQGLDIIGAIESGMPTVTIPKITYDAIISLIPTVLTVTLIGIVECISIAKVLEDEHHSVQPNQELFALGFSKTIGAFFGALPTSGSFSRSAVNHQAKAFSQMSSVITSVFILLSIIFLTPMFYYLPKAILAAIIVFSVMKLFDYQEFKHLWKSHKRDFWVMMISFLATLIIGIEAGVIIGVLLSLILVLYKSSQPRISVLGRVLGTTYYRNIAGLQDLEVFDHKLIVRLEDQLYFGNANYFKDTIKTLVQNHPNEVNELVLDAKSIHEIDSSGIRALSEVLTFLKKKNINLKICGAMAPFRQRVKQSGLLEQIGDAQMYRYLNDGVDD